MMPSEMKEYCNSLQTFQVKVNVRLKAEITKIEGKVAKTESNYFLLQTDSQDAPINLPYLSVANITSV
jgi:hypothetical protein